MTDKAMTAIPGTSSETQSQYNESQYSLDVKAGRARLMAAWLRLLDAIRGSAPKSELYKARREYLDARAALDGVSRNEVRFTLARCMREDRKRKGLPEQDYSVRDFFENYDPNNPDADYYRREHNDAEEAERVVASSMLPDERFDRLLEGVIEGALEALGKAFRGLFQVAGVIALLWALIWLVKTLWYLS